MIKLQRKAPLLPDGTVLKLSKLRPCGYCFLYCISMIPIEIQSVTNPFT